MPTNRGEEAGEGIMGIGGIGGIMGIGAESGLSVG